MKHNQIKTWFQNEEQEIKSILSIVLAMESDSYVTIETEASEWATDTACQLTNPTPWHDF